MTASLPQKGKLGESITYDIEGKSLLDVVKRVSFTPPQLDSLLRS